MSTGAVQCGACGFQFQANGRRGSELAAAMYTTHICRGAPEGPGGAGSDTRIRTQDGRWLYHQEVPNVMKETDNGNTEDDHEPERDYEAERDCEARAQGYRYRG